MHGLETIARLNERAEQKEIAKRRKFKLAQCPRCKGTGVDPILLGAEFVNREDMVDMICSLCNGYGEV